MPHRPAPYRRLLLPALALILGLCLAGCAPSGPARDSVDARLGKGAVRGLRDVPVLATTSSLLESGRESFDAGFYAVAAARFEAVLGKDSDNPEATVYLGLCRWFAGRPDDTAALWNAYPDEALPDFAQQLRENAVSLRLLADRLRARGLVQAALNGRVQPLARGLAVVARPLQIDGAASWPAIPPVGRALQLLLRDALAGYDAPRLPPQGLVDALASEAGLDADGPDKTDEALLLAQLLGAEFAIAATLAPSPADPALVRTRIAVLPTEEPAARRERLAAAAEEAGRAATDARQALVALDHDLTLTAFGLKYFQAGQNLSDLLRRRSEQEERILALNRAGRLTEAVAAVSQLERMETDIAAAQQDLRAQEQAAAGLAAHIFAYNAESLNQRDAELRNTRVELVDRVTERNQRADVAYAEAARVWPPDGIAIDFDLAPQDLPRWPGLAARAVAEILGGRRLPGTLPQAFPPDADTGRLAQLDQALAAWDNGEYAAARDLFDRARPLAPRPPDIPAPEFDPLSQADMPPKDIAALYAARLTSAHQDAHAANRRLTLPSGPPQ